jgi:5-methylcytosine-specific restriction endonuclease McrA
VSQRLPEAEYKALCRAILERDHWRCRSCGSRNALHVHHIVFRSQQGPDAEWNLIALCNACHSGIHVDVREGVMGLVIILPADANNTVSFVRNWGWRPL